MTAETILFELLECGITPTVTPDGDGIEVDAGLLNDAQRAAIRANKYELIACIQDAVRITSELITAAMRACDFWNDSPQAREQMRREILETRPEHREELLRMFKSDYQ
ncbi:hypothetical protein [Comamonas sp. B-9]|uniref:hypothetical protein n=1 Tax=Comamonas sp. B-9 TaxID=1055192 RepID=UPI000395AB22|nr:hypothetical protein [Comamonas sp. B-9]